MGLFSAIFIVIIHMQLAMYCIISQFPKKKLIQMPEQLLYMVPIIVSAYIDTTPDYQTMNIFNDAAAVYCNNSYTV